MLKASLRLLGGTKDEEGKSITGSSSVLSVHNNYGKFNILIDCGLHQGTADDDLYNREFDFDPSMLDAVLLTHAHIDHSGRLPFIVNSEFFKNPFKGKVYTHYLTKEIIQPMLNDAAKIQMMEANSEDENVAKPSKLRIKTQKRRMHKNFPPEDMHQLEEFMHISTKRANAKRPKKAPVEVLYTISDVKKLMHMTIGFDYGYWTNILPGIFIKLYNAAHVLGSAMIVVRLESSKGKYKFLLFSGDIGRVNDPLFLGVPDKVKEPLSWAMIESTYGGKLHTSRESEFIQMEQEILKAIKRSSTILIPAFSYQRTPEILEVLNKMLAIKTGSISVYLDSPLALKLMPIYTSRSECEFLNTMQIKIIQNKADLQKFQKDTGPKILISSGGMIQGGAIIKHLPEILTLSNNRVFLIGHMSEGTFGRLLFDGKKLLEIPKLGCIEVSAKILSFKSFSGHGDEHDLLDLAKSLKLKQDKNTQLFINHGEYDGSALALKNAFSRKKVIDASRIVIPDTTNCYQIL